MDKRRYKLRFPDKPYVTGFNLSTICHRECIPQFVDVNGYFHGYYIVGEEEEDDSYIRDTKCCFCDEI